MVGIYSTVVTDFLILILSDATVNEDALPGTGHSEVNYRDPTLVYLCTYLLIGRFHLNCRILLCWFTGEKEVSMVWRGGVGVSLFDQRLYIRSGTNKNAFINIRYFFFQRLIFMENVLYYVKKTHQHEISWFLINKLMKCVL